MRFADYFGRAFSAVSASQFPWLKLFRESAVAKIADVSWSGFYVQLVCRSNSDKFGTLGFNRLIICGIMHFI